jgi:hypothetical protein
MTTRHYIAKGAATLPTIIALAVLVVVITISITALAFTETLSSQGFSRSSEARFYAEVGARDALMRIARNKAYVCITDECYSVSVATDGCTDNSACAYVTVSSGIGSSGDPKIITSVGHAYGSVRTTQVSVVLDSALDGAITETTWSEL